MKKTLVLVLLLLPSVCYPQSTYSVVKNIERDWLTGTCWDGDTKVECPGFSDPGRWVIGVGTEDPTTSTNPTEGALLWRSDLGSFKYYSSGTWSPIPIGNPVFLADGLVTAPSLGFTNYPTAGLWSSSGHFMFQGQRASGTDQGSTGIYFTSGIGTGTGVGGNISFNIAPPGSSGSSLNATTTAFFVFGGASPYYQLGGMDGATAGGSVIDGVDVKAGVTDGAGGRLDIRGGKGTGAGTPGVVTIQTSKPDASGTTQQTLYTTHLTFNESVGVLFTTAYTFATLPSAPQNGSMVYCSDCVKATPCTGSGSGAFAKRIAGAWDCD